MKGVGSCLDDSIKPVEQCDRSYYIELLRISSYWWTSPSILKLKYLFINTYKDSPIAGLWYMLECYMLVLFINFGFTFETANQPGLEPGSLGPKVATLTIEPHFIDTRAHNFPVVILRFLFYKKYNNLWFKRSGLERDALS